MQDWCAPSRRDRQFLESVRIFFVCRGELSSLQSHAHVGEIRGLGLLLGIEFMKNKSTREPFPKENNIADRIRQAALEENILTYPVQGCVDGTNGDHILTTAQCTVRRCRFFFRREKAWLMLCPDPCFASV